MKIAIGYLHQEVNAFSPVLTTLDNFSRKGIYYGNDIYQQFGNSEIAGFVRAARESNDVTLLPTMGAWAMPSGKIQHDDYLCLRKNFLTELKRAEPFDGILLSFHGAMSSQNEYDVEGDLLEAIRAIWGDMVPVVITLDHHANITKRMIKTVNALTGYQTEPHLDQKEIGYKAARILFDMVRGKVKPVIGWRKIPMIAAGNLLAPDGPLGEFFREAQRLEQERDVLAVSIFPEFMYTDYPELGWTTVAVTNQKLELAQEIANRLAADIWQKRGLFIETNGVSPAKAVEMAIRVHGGPVVLSDRNDATTAGAPGDSNAILKELLDKNFEGSAMLTIVDPPAVAKAIEAGVGEELTLDVGGFFDKLSCKPLQVTGRVKTITDGKYVLCGPVRKGFEQDMKRTAVLKVNNVYIVLSEDVSYNIDPSIYRSVGLEPLESKIVVVKSPYLFKAAYETMAKRIIIVEGPGLAPADIRQLADLFKAAPRPLYPFEENTFFEA